MLNADIWTWTRSDVYCCWFCSSLFENFTLLLRSNRCDFVHFWITGAINKNRYGIGSPGASANQISPQNENQRVLWKNLDDNLMKVSSRKNATNFIMYESRKYSGGVLSLVRYSGSSISNLLHVFCNGDSSFTRTCGQSPEELYSW